MKQSLKNFYKLTMNPIIGHIKLIIIHQSSWNSLMNFHEQTMNMIDPDKNHDCLWNSHMSFMN